MQIGETVYIKPEGAHKPRAIGTYVGVTDGDKILVNIPAHQRRKYKDRPGYHQEGSQVWMKLSDLWMG